MIRAIIFDCFGVFYVDPVEAYLRNPHSPPALARQLHELDDQAARGKLSKAAFETQAGALLGRAPAVIEQQFFEGKRRNQALVEYAEELRAHYKVGMLSNIGIDMMDTFFSPSERQQLFDAVVLSGEVKLAKPDPAIFRLACERLGVRPDEAIMVDDVASNCDAARAIGMQAVHYQNFAQAKASLVQLLSA